MNIIMLFIDNTAVVNVFHTIKEVAMPFEKVPEDDRSKQGATFSVWWRNHQNHWKTLSQFSRDTSIDRKALRRYMSGDAIARGNNRATLYAITNLECFAPHPSYHEALTAGTGTTKKKPRSTKKKGMRKQAAVQKKTTHESGFNLLDKKVDAIFEDISRLRSAIDGMTNTLNSLIAAFRDSNNISSPTRVQEQSGNVTLVLPDLPEIKNSPHALLCVREQLVGLTKTLSSYSNLPANSTLRESARTYLLDATQQLFVALLLFDKQFPGDFADEAERFVDLLDLDVTRESNH